jgi:hypothetical protein
MRHDPIHFWRRETFLEDERKNVLDAILFSPRGVRDLLLFDRFPLNFYKLCLLAFAILAASCVLPISWLFDP